MGGKLISTIFGLPEKRLNKIQYENLSNWVNGVLQLGFPGKRVKSPRTVKSKTSWGDYDVIVESDGSNINYSKELKLLFNTEVHKNGNVYSFPVQGFQVDVIVTYTDKFESSLSYFDFEAGMSVGRLAFRAGFKHGIDGLFLKVPLDTLDSSLPSHHHHNFLITRNTEEIYKILGLSYERFRQGFQNNDEVFSWISSSPYFCPSAFAPESMNHENRTRNAKRPTFGHFVTLCQSIPKKAKLDKEAIKNKILSDYPRIVKEMEEFKEKRLKDEERRKKFNGGLVIELLGLSGKEIGDFIKKFNQSHSPLNEYLDGHTEEEVKKEIISFK